MDNKKEAKKALPSDRAKALAALDEMAGCLWRILSIAHKNGVTELAKFKFKEQLELVRTELQQPAPEVLTHDELFKRFPFFKRMQTLAIMHNFPNGIIIKGEELGKKVCEGMDL